MKNIPIYYNKKIDEIDKLLAKCYEKQKIIQNYLNPSNIYALIDSGQPYSQAKVASFPFFFLNRSNFKEQSFNYDDQESHFYKDCSYIRISNLDSKRKYAALGHDFFLNHHSIHLKSCEGDLIKKCVYNQNKQKYLLSARERFLRSENSTDERNFIDFQIKESEKMANIDFLSYSNDIDQERIVRDHLTTRSVNECKLLQENKLNPTLNNSKQTAKEDKELMKVVEKYSGHNWPLITEEFTRCNFTRNIIQCFIRYQTFLRKNFSSSIQTKEEDEKLISLVNELGINKQKEMENFFEFKTSINCKKHYDKVLNPSIVSGTQTQDEDIRLILAKRAYSDFVKHKFQPFISSHVPGRTDCKCRERYFDVLDPKIFRSKQSQDEDQLLIELVKKHGEGKQSLISSFIENRNDNQCFRRYKRLQTVSKKTQRKKYVRNAKPQNLDADDEKTKFKQKQLIKSLQSAEKNDISENKQESIKNSKIHQNFEDFLSKINLTVNDINKSLSKPKVIESKRKNIKRKQANKILQKNNSDTNENENTFASSKQKTIRLKRKVYTLNVARKTSLRSTSNSSLLPQNIKAELNNISEKMNKKRCNVESTTNKLYKADKTESKVKNVKQTKRNYENKNANLKKNNMESKKRKTSTAKKIVMFSNKTEFKGKNVKQTKRDYENKNTDLNKNGMGCKKRKTSTAKKKVTSSLVKKQQKITELLN